MCFFFQIAISMKYSIYLIEYNSRKKYICYQTNSFSSELKRINI